MLNKSDMRPAYATAGQSSSYENSSKMNYATFSAAQTNIADISPLAGLTKLQKVYLANNRIQDVTPLANLSELTLTSPTQLNWRKDLH